MYFRHFLIMWNKLFATTRSVIYKTLFCLKFMFSNIAFVLVGTLVFAELSTVVPKSGGCYAFFLESFKDIHPYFGPLPGFIFIWSMVFIVLPTCLAITTIVLSDYNYEPFRPYFSSSFNSNFENTIKTVIGTISLGNLIFAFFTTRLNYIISANEMFNYL